MKEIHYSLHLEFRLKFREIPYELPRKIYKTLKEKYFDNETKKLIIIGIAEYKGKLREIVVVYEEDDGKINIVTVHPLKQYQKISRIKSGRWRKI